MVELGGRKINYLRSIAEWSQDQWHSFGFEFLQQAGWEPDWKSNMDVFSIDGKRFLVSFINNLGAGPIGISIERDIVSRLKRAGAEGFVGFYSGDYSTSLCDRLKKLNVQVVLISGVQVSVLLPYFSSFFIDRYFGNKPLGSSWSWSCYLSKFNSGDYKPLFCMCGCGQDILISSLAIGSSAAFIHRSCDDLYLYYGLKSCIFKICDDNTSCGWVEINQLLHPDQFNIWNRMLLDFLNDNSCLDLTAYHGPKRLLTSRLLQRMRSVNAGFFLGGQEF